MVLCKRVSIAPPKIEEIPKNRTKCNWLYQHVKIKEEQITNRKPQPRHSKLAKLQCIVFWLNILLGYCCGQFRTNNIYLFFITYISEKFSFLIWIQYTKVKVWMVFHLSVTQDILDFNQS